MKNVHGVRAVKKGLDVVCIYTWAGFSTKHQYLERCWKEVGDSGWYIGTAQELVHTVEILYIMWTRTSPCPE